MIYRDTDVTIDGIDGGLVRGDAAYVVEWLDARQIEWVMLLELSVGRFRMVRDVCVKIAGNECIEAMEAAVLERIERNPGDYTE